MSSNSLDLYVGTLTRYYSGDWEGARAPAAEPLIGGSPEDVRTAVLEWRQRVYEALTDYLSGPLDWVEEEDLPYFTARPDWQGYSDLQLWAAYEEQPALEPPKLSVADWTDDPAYVESTRPGFRSRYAHLLDSVELWLPCDFTPVFAAPDVARRSCCIGSSIRLVRQLEELNRRTWQAPPEALERWRQQPPAPGATLEESARSALATLLSLGAASVAYGLPMKLDY